MYISSALLTTLTDVSAVETGLDFKQTVIMDISIRIMIRETKLLHDITKNRMTSGI